MDRVLVQILALSGVMASRCLAAESRRDLMVFLKIGDRSAGAIKSGGTTRRAAKMVICDADHPDIEEFINWKVKEEQKGGFDSSGVKKIGEAKLNGIFDAIKEVGW